MLTCANVTPNFARLSSARGMFTGRQGDGVRAPVEVSLESRTVDGAHGSGSGHASQLACASRCTVERHDRLGVMEQVDDVPVQQE